MALSLSVRPAYASTLRRRGAGRAARPAPLPRTHASAAPPRQSASSNVLLRRAPARLPALRAAPGDDAPLGVLAELTDTSRLGQRGEWLCVPP